MVDSSARKIPPCAEPAADSPAGHILKLAMDGNARRSCARCPVWELENGAALATRDAVQPGPRDARPGRGGRQGGTTPRVKRTTSWTLSAVTASPAVPSAKVAR